MTSALVFAAANSAILTNRAAAAKPAQPRRDPPGQFFRVAPMAQASRSIVIPLSTNVHFAFDTELLRTHTVWKGPGLNLFGTPYHGGKTPFLSTVEGVSLWGMPPFCPWFTEPPNTTVLGSPNSAASVEAQYKGMSTSGGRVAIRYNLNFRMGTTVQVEEIPLAEGNGPVVVRKIQVGPSDRDLWFLAHAETGSSQVEFAKPSAFLIARSNDVLLTTVSDVPADQVHVTDRAVQYDAPSQAEDGGESVTRIERISGRQSQLWIHVPRGKDLRTFQIESVVLPNVEEAKQWADRVIASAADRKRAFANSRPEIASRTNRFSGSKPSRPGGDEYYEIEHFPLPREIALMVTGMDWMPNGDLAVCTWLGEIYVVEGAQGSVEAARYRRFAEGLNEPLGIRVVGNQMYVVQKSELTRISDTNNDGVADLFETICNKWGYTGNYHAFAFGPALDRKGNLFALLCGQRGTWEVPFVGWGVRIDAQGNLEPYCSGLRAPNGIGTYGPNDDLFATDNQGNWIGACKLNHLQRGEFYGYPSGRPSAKEIYGKAMKFKSPAVWFPRKLSPSTSGFAAVQSPDFGPFEGQLMVGDFQNAVVMRVFLEQVNGQWQGAVWPFARGFYSGVNRLLMGNDGRLYVGGLKNSAWAASAPFEFSLDRMRFKGTVPFEVKEVNATADGFTLRFTEPVERTHAIDPENYYVSQYTYKYHSAYGSPEIDHEGKENSATEVNVLGVTVSADGTEVRLKLETLKPGYVASIQVSDLTAASGKPIWHDTFYYTLNEIPRKTDRR
jgi:glucose/arabinose dehydrogenase